MRNIPIDWKVFEYKFSSNPRTAFENLSYALFCAEFNIDHGVFRYFNQPYIETQPVDTNDNYITGFQAKYYDASTSISDRVQDFKEAIKGAKGKYHNINRLIIYTNKELSASSKKDKTKPQYQINIEKCGEDEGVRIEWRVKSNFEIMLQSSKLSALRDLYFNPNNGLQNYLESVDNHTEALMNTIESTIRFSEKTIKISRNEEFADYLDWDNSVLVVYGNAGTGKSGFIKDYVFSMKGKYDDLVLVTFQATDFDVENEESVLSSLHSSDYGINDLLSAYSVDEKKICVIDSAEKYCTFKNPLVIKKVIQNFINQGWKIVVTIREQYKEGFCNSVLENATYKPVCIDKITGDELSSLTKTYDFALPEDNKLCGLLYNLFYLKIYLKLISTNLNAPSNTKSFKEYIWQFIIRNESIKRDNLPARRENLAVNILLTLLKKESYIYKADADDDNQALECLEESGIISPYDNSGDLWLFSHDVYEELVFNHIISSRYDNDRNIKSLTGGLPSSFRTRKMFRIWLEAKLNEPDDFFLPFLIDILQENSLEQSWKDETLIALMNTANDDAYQIMESLLSQDNFSMFTRTVFLLNTACINLNLETIKLFEGNEVINYRFTKPFGDAWNHIFSYIKKNINLIPWNTKNLSVVIESMKSWVNNNASGETTRLIGQIALSLRKMIWTKCKQSYRSEGKEFNSSLNKIILQSAFEIKDELTNIIDDIIQHKAFRHSTENYELLTKSLSDIFGCGRICHAMPTKLMDLAKAYWLFIEDNNHYSSIRLNDSFGLNEHIDFDYYPSSAFQTPIYFLLKSSPRECIDFIISLMNHCAVIYQKSDLNLDYSECSEIEIILTNDNKIKQIGSERLWELYRGTGVAPHLLASVLMALEKFLLDYIDNVPKEQAVSICLYLLKESNNVAITSVVMSLVLANPDKLFDISCILLKTKEVFSFDYKRLSSEYSANAFRGSNLNKKLFDDERIASNKQKFRQTSFENMILNYQFRDNSISESDFKNRLNKLYEIIDETKENIDSWEPLYQYPYYRMDLRTYKQTGKSFVNDNRLCVPVESELPDNLKEISRKQQEKTDQISVFTELMLWSSYRYKNNEKYKEYKRFEDNPIAALEELNEIMEAENRPELFLEDSTVIYTAAVLLRDFSNQLDDELKNDCKTIILSAGYKMLESEQFAFQVEERKAIVNELSRMSSEETFIADWDNPMFLLLAIMMDYRKQYINNLVNPLYVLWEINPDIAKQFFYIFSTMIPLKNKENTISFMESHKDEIMSLYSESIDNLESIDISKLDFNALMYLCAILNANDNSVLPFVIKSGKYIWQLLFTSKYDNGYNRNFYLEVDYKKWFADYLLNLSAEKQNELIKAFMPKVDINREFKDLLSWILICEDSRPRYDSFWNLWISIREYIFASYEESIESYKDINKSERIGLGREDALMYYLIANPFWSERVNEWHSLKEKDSSFYLVASNRLGYNPTTLFSIAYVLNTIGKKVFFNNGIVWLSSIIEHNPHLLHKTLPENTIYYIEEYIYYYVKKDNSNFRFDNVTKKKVLEVLDFLVNRGSTVGFLLREDIL